MSTRLPDFTDQQLHMLAEHTVDDITDNLLRNVSSGLTPDELVRVRVEMHDDVYMRLVSVYAYGIVVGRESAIERAAK